MKKFLICTGLGIAATASAHAGEYHFKDVLIGERASGMGGAYVAIADDPSGMYHNPAGIVFSQENYFSLSANAFSTSTETYANIVPGQNYSYTSQSILPAFFGFTQAFGKHKFGFSVVVPNSDLIDQDDTISGLSTVTADPNTFRRRFFRQDITYLAGPSFAMEVANNVTVGVSLYGFYRFLNAIDNQVILYNPIPIGKYFEQNAYLRMTSIGLAPKLGVQYMPVPKLSLGATVSGVMNVGGSGSKRVYATKQDASGKPVDFQNNYDADKLLAESSISPKQSTSPSFSFGAAYFANKKAMLTTQVDYHLADAAFGYRNTLNLSAGGEFYTSEEIALRAGIYTNNSKTTPVVEGQMNQQSHVNLLGATLALALCKPGSSLSFGASYATGSGQGQALGDSVAIQTVKQNQLAFYLTGSYQL